MKMRLALLVVMLGGCVSRPDVIDAGTATAGGPNTTTPVPAESDSAAHPSGPLAEPDEFDIELDYHFDTSQAFDYARRRLLEAAAREWERYIEQGFPEVPAGTTIQAGDTRLTLHRPVDDLLIFPGSFVPQGPAGGLAYTKRWTWASDSPAAVMGMLSPRLADFPYQPWAATITFNETRPWFIDPTPDTGDDLPGDGSFDFYRVLLHEIGHALAFYTGSRTALYARYTADGMFFRGPRAMELYGGPVPIGNPIRAHFAEDVTYHGQMPLMVSGSNVPRNKRLRITALDLAVLQDVGYKIRWDRVPN